MALPDQVQQRLIVGSTIVWGESGGTSPNVTKTLSLDALGNGSGRMGASADLGEDHEVEYLLEVQVETGTAPAAGEVVEVYLATSRDGSDWPGKVTGSDAAYPSTVADNKRLLGAPAAVLVAPGDANTVIKQQGVLWRCTGRYVAPVVVNLLGQAFRDESTASDNGSRVILTPISSRIND